MDNKKIDGYLERMIDEFECGNFSEARMYAINVIDKDPWNHTAIIFKRFIENNLKKSNGRYKHSITCDDFISLINLIINYGGQNKCPEIFVYCKKFLKNISVIPDDKLIEDCKTIIDSLSGITTDSVADFLNYFKKFHDGITKVVEDMNNEIENENKDIAKHSKTIKELDKQLEKWNLQKTILLVVTIVLWLVLMLRI